MAPEDSLPHSQEPAKCTYSEPDQSSPCPYMSLPEDPSYFSRPMYVWGFQVVSFFQISPPKPCMHLFPPKRDTCLAHVILFDLITRILLGEQ